MDTRKSVAARAELALKTHFSMVSKPDFFIIGASKAGTSSFSLMLEQHPQIHLTRPHEPNFFSVHYDKGWDWYEARFPKQTNGGILGEKSPTYSHVQQYPKVAARIQRDVPDAKLIYVVRHPKERIESRWMQDRASGLPQTSFDFNSAVRSNLHGIVDTTRYLQQIDAYSRLFPEEQIHVVFFEELIAKPAEIMANTFRFLGVNPDFHLEHTPHTNASIGKQEDGRVLTYLRRFLPRDTRALPVPERARRLVRTTLKRQVNDRPRWEASTIEWLRQELGEDTRAFLRRYRNDDNYWKL